MTDFLSTSLGALVKRTALFGIRLFTKHTILLLAILLISGFAAALFNGQDTLQSSSNNGFLNDSLFRTKYNGFEIKVTNGMGNTLYYVNLAEAKSRFEFHFHKTIK